MKRFLRSAWPVRRRLHESKIVFSTVVFLFAVSLRKVGFFYGCSGCQSVAENERSIFQLEPEIPNYHYFHLLSLTATKTANSRTEKKLRNYTAQVYFCAIYAADDVVKGAPAGMRPRGTVG